MRRTTRRLPALVLLALVVAACSGDIGGDALRTEAAEPLDDGVHFGFVVALDPAEFVLELDVAELLEGEEARDAAEAEGGVVTEGGHYVRNAEPRTVSVVLDEDLEVRLLRPCCELHAVPFEAWLADFEPDDRTFYGTANSHYEVTLEDGRAVAVDEVHVP